MVRKKQYTEQYNTYLSPTEDRELMDFINQCDGNGQAAQMRTAMRAMWAVYKQAQQAQQEPAHTETQEQAPNDELAPKPEPVAATRAQVASGPESVFDSYH